MVRRNAKVVFCVFDWGAFAMGIKGALTVLALTAGSWLLVIGVFYVAMRFCQAVFSVL